MLRIRLRRVGKKKQPMYRIVVADSHAPRDGAFVENLGYYHPMDNPSTIVIDEERAKHWLGKGAQPSDRVAKILKIQGIAELPQKLVTRMAFIEERDKGAKEASKAKAAEEAKAEASKAEASKAEAPKAEAPKAEAPKAEAATAKADAEEPKAEVPAEDAKADEPKAEAPAKDAKADEPKAEAPAKDAKDEEKSE